MDKDIVSRKNTQGYSRKFQKPLIYRNKPQPTDLFEVGNKNEKGFWRNFKDYWIQKGKNIKKGWIRFTNLFRKNKIEPKTVDIFTGTKQETVFGEEVNVAAQINNVYLTFKNPNNPKEKNVVLRGANLKIYEGKIHALVGESGSGKSVVSSLLYGLTGKNSVIETGTVKLYGLEVQNYTAYNWENSRLRGRIVSAVFQNPMSILDPTMKVGKQIMEGMLVNKMVKNKKEAYSEALRYLKLTKINNPEKVMKAYPHELSGGMIQRIAIAAIVSLKPKILIMDEPTTALDPTVQAFVLDIIRELQETFKISILFISHDLGVVASMADFINIMYAGQVIESGTKEEILYHPQHPYTWGLILSMPDFNKGERLQVIKGAVPSNLNNIKGDAFAVRNDYALGIDFEEEPPVYQISPTHYVKSNLLNEKAPDYKPPKTICKLWKNFDEKLLEIVGGDKAKMYVDDSTFLKHKAKSEEHNKLVSELEKEIDENSSKSKDTNNSETSVKQTDSEKIKQDKEAQNE